MARRKTEVFSMSFLDCITCAFGSVVLVYVLINARGGLRAQAETQLQLSEVKQLEQQVLVAYQSLADKRNTMAMTDDERARMEGLSVRIVQQAEQTKEELADADQVATSR